MLPYCPALFLRRNFRRIAIKSLQPSKSNIWAIKCSSGWFRTSPKRYRKIFVCLNMVLSFDRLQWNSLMLLELLELELHIHVHLSVIKCRRCTMGLSEFKEDGYLSGGWSQIRKDMLPNHKMISLAVSMYFQKHLLTIISSLLSNSSCWVYPHERTLKREPSTAFSVVLLFFLKLW